MKASNPIGVLDTIKALVLQVTGNYRVRDDQRRVDCPHPDFQDAFLILPKEWLGEHAIRKDKATALAESIGSDDITNFAICMAIIDDWGNIPGMDSKELSDWDFNIVPIPIMQWIVETVLTDFLGAFIVPKASAEQLPKV